MNGSFTAHVDIDPPSTGGQVDNGVHLALLRFPEAERAAEEQFERGRQAVLRPQRRVVRVGGKTDTTRIKGTFLERVLVKLGLQERDQRLDEDHVQRARWYLELRRDQRHLLHLIKDCVVCSIREGRQLAVRVGQQVGAS